jgi:signal transduction histidine kinase
VYIITVYFFYGLSFFSMGLAVMLEVGRSSKLDFARALRFLGGFGLVHGTHEWVEMFILINPRIQELSIYDFIGHARVVLLAISFLLLIAFGANLIAGPQREKLSWQLIGVIAAIWAAGLVILLAQRPDESGIIASDVYTRYALAIPGAALTSWGLVLQRQKFLQAGMKGFGRDVVIAAAAFGMYGGIGQLFASPSIVFPSAFLNSEVFFEFVGFPIQLFRSVMACMAAVSIISTLRAFEEETRRQIENLNEAQRMEQKRIEDLRAELLRRTVRAQEAERQRIARELHDEVGQTLTALGMGLRAISDVSADRLDRVKTQTRQLLNVVDDGLTGLQNLIAGLHPPQLDDFGLLAALRGYCLQVKEHARLTVDIESRGDEPDIPSVVRTLLYRIVQECITNIIRHAKTDQANLLVVFDPAEIRIRVEDNGCGFNTEETFKKPGHPCWGLLGMIERAGLVGGDCLITSEPGVGTLVEASVPLSKQES